jgi:hypothetical protein
LEISRDFEVLSLCLSLSAIGKWNVVQTYPLDFDLENGKMRSGCFRVRIQSHASPSPSAATCATARPESGGTLPLQILEDRHGLETGVILKQILNLVPDLNERVGPGSSMYRRRHLALQPASAAVLPRWLRVHSSLGRRDLLVFLCVYQCKQPPTCLSVTNPPPPRHASESAWSDCHVRIFWLSLVGLYDCRGCPGHS